jgi:hypothetical protein
MTEMSSPGDSAPSRPRSPASLRTAWSAIKETAELLKGLSLFGVFCLLVVYVVRELRHDVLIFNPIETPQRLKDAGVTPEILARRIGQAVRRIEATTYTQMKKDNIASVEEVNTIPDIEVPGTSLGLKNLVDIVRTAFAIRPGQVSGDIVLSDNTAAGDAPASADLRPTWLTAVVSRKLRTC